MRPVGDTVKKKAAVNSRERDGMDMTPQEIVDEITNNILTLNREEHGDYRIRRDHAKERARNIATWVIGLIEERGGMNLWQTWKANASPEDRKSVTQSLGARRALLSNGYKSMATKIEKMLISQFPSLPEEAFHV